MRLLLFVILFGVACVASGQISGDGRFTIVSYNVENFFDTVDDSLTLDDEFTPKGIRRWSYYRFVKKRNDLFKTLMAVCGGAVPDIVGLCEVENRWVVEQLLEQTPFYKYNYEIIHQESADRRGIDVAFIYRVDRFVPLKYEVIEVVTDSSTMRRSRDILYVEGCVKPTGDTLHLFMNHWTSRYRGVAESFPLRMIASRRLKSYTDLLLAEKKMLVAMGDFNDEPSDRSMKLLGESGLINLSKDWQGTIKHKEHWFVFDQFLISPQLKRSFGVEAKEVRLPFLLTKDDKYLGEKMNRTFIGMRYNGGVSDHLPILLTLFY